MWKKLLTPENGRKYTPGKCKTQKMAEQKMHDMENARKYTDWKMAKKHTLKMSERKMHYMENGRT